ncbi:LamG domain-containing protein [Arenibacter sp. 6A1]|uniref:LamG domain-containing protein n=1 Tax=Arenibacter sp. 6A1 TaxID=2720391 RepID=UPI001447504B|nr:LamG domain-containing protein [Arenibacter sp. 6A1]NKI26984.1 LamG domain-containing protein [Arenibacter sp. 6A1]
MNRIIYKKIVYLFLPLIGFISCNNDDSFQEDTRLAGKEGVYIYHPNPVTGEEYTTEELGALTYDPYKIEKYSVGEDISLQVVAQARPLKIMVSSTSNPSIATTLTAFKAFGDEWISEKFKSEVTELGLEVGERITLDFEIIYNDQNKFGFDRPSLGSTSFDIERAEDRIPVTTSFIVFLKKQIGNLIGLETEDEVTSIETDLLTGSAITFDGTNDLVTIGNTQELDFRFTENHSIGFWVKTTSTVSDPAMVSDKDWGSGGNDGFVFAYTGGSWKLNYAGAGSRVDLNGGTINDGNWHFLMATFDRSGDLTIYQDGVAQGNVDISSLAGVPINSGLPIRIGQDGTGSYGIWFEGQIANLVIYDYVLNAGEVEKISTPSGVTLRRSIGAVSNIGTTNEGDATVSIEENRYTYTFSGSNYVTLDNDGDLDFRYDGDYSISFWVNTTSTTSDPIMIGDQNWASSGNKGLSIAFRGDNWRVAVGDGAGNKADAATSGIPFNDGNWHMLTVTLDRDENMLMYQDGVLVASADMSNVTNTDSGNPLRIAQDGTGSYGVPFQGKIANSMIFDYVLSADEIAELFIE